MRAMRAEAFGRYEDLKLTVIPSPTLSDGRILVWMTAAGVTPLDHTILSGQYPKANAPLVLGNEGAGVIEEGGTAEFPKGSRVMFTGPYGVFENGTLSELVAVQEEHLCLVPDNVDDAAAAGLPVAYLTAFLALKAAGFQAWKTVLAPAIGGSVGNARRRPGRLGMGRGKTGCADDSYAEVTSLRKAPTVSDRAKGQATITFCLRISDCCRS
jgi:NADPH2:quinone reductase